MLKSDYSDAQSQMPISKLCDKILVATSENLDQPSQSDQNIHWAQFG